jgi:hypothetical protein
VESDQFVVDLSRMPNASYLEKCLRNVSFIAPFIFIFFIFFGNDW